MGGALEVELISGTVGRSAASKAGKGGKSSVAMELEDEVLCDDAWE